MRTRADDAIWPGYADLMTNLFAVALILFVLTHWLLTVRYKMSAEKWAKVQEVEQAVSRLADEKLFVYQPAFKRHVLSEEVQFEIGQAKILPKYHRFLESAGRSVERLIAELKSKSQANIKYLIIIEGMASRDGYANNFELSYSRALALFRLWQQLGINLPSDICEVIIAGSGAGGVGRHTDEARNQRFLIQILPKVDAEGWDSRATALAAPRPR